MLCRELVINYIMIMWDSGQHNITNKGNSHSGLTDVISSHLLVHI